jgi:hypothetical protein
MLIQADGWSLLTDPTFDDPGRRYAFGWGTSSRKIAGPAILRVRRPDDRRRRSRALTSLSRKEASEDLCAPELKRLA